MLRRRGSAGLTLLESLVSILLTSLVILGLAAGLLTSVRSSEQAQRVQRLDSSLSSFSESLRSMPYPTVSPPGTCPQLTDFKSAWATYQLTEGWIPPAGTTAEIIGVEHWQPSGAQVGTYDTACATDPHAHRLTLEVTESGHSVEGQTVMAGPQ